MEALSTIIFVQTVCPDLLPTSIILTRFTPPWSSFSGLPETLPPGPEVLNIPTEKKTLYFQIVTVFFLLLLLSFLS